MEFIPSKQKFPVKLSAFSRLVALEAMVSGEHSAAALGDLGELFHPQ